jgi:hypothetical protein
MTLKTLRSIKIQTERSGVQFFRHKGRYVRLDYSSRCTPVIAIKAGIAITNPAFMQWNSIATFGESVVWRRVVGEPDRVLAWIVDWS